MHSVLATHRDISYLGLRHRTWLRIVLALLVLQSVWWWRSGPSASTVHAGASSSSAAAPAAPVERTALAALVAPRRVAIVMPLLADWSAKLRKRFKSWNGKRSPCVGEPGAHRPDLVFYLGPEWASANKAVIADGLGDASRCFGAVRMVDAPEHATLDTAFYSLFSSGTFAPHYDVFFWMAPDVLAVRAGWATKVYEQAVLSDPFWVRGSAVMQTCPASALTSNGDCDGSINLAFPGVLHININALYALGNEEFSTLLAHAQARHEHSPPDVALFEELVSTDHPLTSKLGKGMRRKLHSVDEAHHEAPKHHDEDPAVSAARDRGARHHKTSLYWSAHAHRYQYSDFIINAVAGKKHLQAELRAGEHTNTYFVNEHVGK